MIVGAGTVLDEETARIAIMKGARYMVSPHFDGNIATMCNRYVFRIYLVVDQYPKLWKLLHLA